MQGFHPLTRAWFGSAFTGPTEPQLQAWPQIRAGHDVLIAAPTGSGKTLAAFLICLDDLIARAAAPGGLPDHVEVVYVSPLKALSADIHRNLEAPLAGIAALAAAGDVELEAVRTAVRTGDTPAAERARMMRRPPHVLVTTPESLFILLTAERGRRVLQRARVVIVDEIHAMVDDKRGAHLALTLARLDHLVRQAGGARPQRIGLSATVNPIGEVARFLRGAAAADPVIVDAGHRRELDLAVEVPEEELGMVASNEMWGQIYDRIARLVSEHRTTLVFVNTRRLAERVAHHLAERAGADAVLAHHGSLSRQLRQQAETELKAGRLRAVVATASLELGIDIGTVDLVCQIGSPRSIAVALQRVGRSGHRVARSSVPRGRFFPTTRDELLETAALVRAVRGGGLDRRVIPDWPRDILAQQIVAAAACEPWDEDELFELVRGAHPYRALPRSEFDAVVTMLADGIATDRGRHGAYVHRDRVNRALRGRRGGRLAAMTSGGAIPDNANYLVVAEPEGVTVGTVDEDFAVESLAGDVFLLGTTSWRIRRVQAGQVRVEDARGAAPSIPFWRGEAPGRTPELSAEVSAVRLRVADLAGVAGGDGAAPGGAAGAAETFLQAECGLNAWGAEQAAAYVTAGVAGLGAVPSAGTVVAERFFDEGGGMQLVIHAPFGARINRAWGLALAQAVLPLVQLRAAGGGNRQRHRHLAGGAAQLPPGGDLPLPVAGDRRGRAHPGHAAGADVHRALALERLPRAGRPALRRRPQGAAADPAHAFGRPARIGLSGSGRLPGESHRRDTHPRSPARGRDDPRLPARGDGPRRPARGDRRHRGRPHRDPHDRDGRAVGVQPRDSERQPVRLSRRRAARRAPRARGAIAPHAAARDAREVGALDAAAIAEVARESWPVVRDADELHEARC